MAGETPAGGTIKTGGGEGVEAQLGCAAVDILHYGFEGSKVFDLVDGMAGFFQQGLVDDDAEALVAIADGSQFAALFIEVEVVRGHFGIDGRVGQIQAEVAPGIQTGFIAALEQRRRGRALVHFGGQRFGIGAGSGGNNGDRNAGLLGILRSQRLPGGVRLGLKVEIVNLADCGGGLRCRRFGRGGSRGRLGRGRFCRFCARKACDTHQDYQNQSN
ncbi:hypothetical protein SDC9_146759 [bioreactor metagenome]|uniref:Uncharacterized protein n=1 Tax=bioreactor metagenome TaxID=1076179 RepID=A0A645EC61_9ZZZZ